MVIRLKFNKYAQACKDLDDEHMDIFQNILLPVLTGQSVIHIRTHEEPRLIGICEAIASRISADFKLLHVLTEAGVETSLLLGESRTRIIQACTSVQLTHLFNPRRVGSCSYSVQIEPQGNPILLGNSKSMLKMDYEERM